jgi:hypothetical protein
MARRTKKSQQGMAMIELLPLLAIFVLLINYSVGYWAAVQTGILHSIAARNYLFETLRHRPVFAYVRTSESNTGGNITECIHYQRAGYRFALVRGDVDRSNSEESTATARRISMTGPSTIVGDSVGDHMAVYEISNRNRSVKVSPIWVKVGYGICLNSRCGP